MQRILMVVSGAVSACFAAGIVSAHHSVAAEFDRTQIGELSGDITQVWFTNPHVRYRLSVTVDDGSREDWELQGGNVTNLLRMNWTADSLRVGDRVTVTGELGRDGARKLNIRELQTADGRVLPPRDRARDDLNVVNASSELDYGYRPAVRPHDITGPWRNDYRWRVTVNDLEPQPVPFTPEGRQLFEATEAWQDYALRCVAPGLPRIFGAPYNMEIVDAGSHYLMVFIEHNTPRRIWMDDRRPEVDALPTPMGFSVGRWEDRTLVVETTNLSPGWLDGSGLPMAGEGTRIVEHYVLSDDGLTMERIMTVHDRYYSDPVVRRRGSARSEHVDLTEQLPCDPDSHYRDLAAGGRLEEHFRR
jgi:hypothetical protein